MVFCAAECRAFWNVCIGIFRNVAAIRLLFRRDRHVLDRLAEAHDHKAQMAGAHVKHAPMQPLFRAGFVPRPMRMRRRGTFCAKKNATTWSLSMSALAIAVFSTYSFAKPKRQSRSPRMFSGICAAHPSFNRPNRCLDCQDTRAGRFQFPPQPDVLLSLFLGP